MPAIPAKTFEKTSSTMTADPTAWPNTQTEQLQKSWRKKPARPPEGARGLRTSSCRSCPSPETLGVLEWALARPPGRKLRLLLVGRRERRLLRPRSSRRSLRPTSSKRSFRPGGRASAHSRTPSVSGDGHERQEEVLNPRAPSGGRAGFFLHDFWSCSVCVLGQAVGSAVMVLLVFSKVLAGIAGMHFLL